MVDRTVFGAAGALGRASLTAALLSASLVLPASALAQGLVSGESLAKETCETGIGDLDGALADASGGSADEARRLLQKAQSELAAGQYSACFESLQRGLALVGDSPDEIGSADDPGPRQ